MSVLVALDSAYTSIVPNALFPAKPTEGRLGVTLYVHGCLPAIGVLTVFSERMARWHKPGQGAGMKALPTASSSHVSQNFSQFSSARSTCSSCQFERSEVTSRSGLGNYSSCLLWLSQLKPMARRKMNYSTGHDLRSRGLQTKKTLQ